MDKLRTYSIPFVGLKKGVHTFDYTIEAEFFELMEQDLLQQGKVEVKLDLNKKDTIMELDFRFSGVVRLSCDRCLEEFDYELEGEDRLIVKFGHETEEESEEILVLASNETEINVAQYIYEFISLRVPMRHVHPDDKDGNSTCDPEFLAKIEELSRHEDEEHEPDPRWAALKNLKDFN
jgi:uncharacterized protein